MAGLPGRTPRGTPAPPATRSFGRGDRAVSRRRTCTSCWRTARCWGCRSGIWSTRRGSRTPARTSSGAPVSGSSRTLWIWRRHPQGCFGQWRPWPPKWFERRARRSIARLVTSEDVNGACRHPVAVDGVAGQVVARTMVFNRACGEERQHRLGASQHSVAWAGYYADEVALRDWEPVLYPHSAVELRTWLQEHHQAAAELGIGLRHRAVDPERPTWADLVDELLCFGWIDSVVHAVEDGQVIRVTPRRADSMWSPRNLTRAAALRSEGRMTSAGEEALSRRLTAPGYGADGHWRLDPDAETELRKDPAAWAFFEVSLASVMGPPCCHEDGTTWTCYRAWRASFLGSTVTRPRCR